jgi:NDP-mannose synthase
MKAVILAGGLGIRLKPFTEVIPKPLLPIGEKAIMELQIEQLKSYGFDDIILATNYKSDYIANFFGDGSRFGVKLKINKENEPLGTAGPIGLLRDDLNDAPFLVMNGDILTKCNFKIFMENAIKIESDLILGLKEYTTPFRFGNISSDGDFVTKIDEKPILKTNILAGIYIMKPSLLKSIPDNTYFGMDDLINLKLNNNELVGKIDIKEYWLDIGVIDDYKEIQSVYDKHFL